MIQSYNTHVHRMMIMLMQYLIHQHVEFDPLWHIKTKILGINVEFGVVLLHYFRIHVLFDQFGYIIMKK